jgi:hypothetical protein
MDWMECIDCLDSDKKDWRENSLSFNPTASLRGDIALAFFKAHELWVSDCALPIYENQLEWIAMMFDSADASRINELTANAIWSYISQTAHTWLLECEEQNVAW